MTILAVTGTYSPTTNGVAISLAVQKREFEKHGHLFTVIAPRHPGQIPDTRVIRMPSLPNPFIPDYPILIPFSPVKLAKHLLPKYDLVYFHHPFYVGNIALDFARLYSCPSVFFYHSQYAKMVAHFLPHIVSSPISARISSSVMTLSNRCSGIICETPTVKNYLLSSGIKSPVEVIPTSRNFPRITVSKNALRLKYQLPPDIILVLCVSRLSPEKNLIALIRSFSQINSSPPVCLVLAGDGPQKNRLQNYSSTTGLKNIFFLGNIPFPQIHEIYSLADIFAYPSLTDTQALVILEAMSCKLPVVAFRTPGPQDFVLHNKNGLLATSLTEFTTYLQQLVSHPQLQKQFGAKSKLLSQNYSLDHTTKQTELFFQRLITDYYFWQTGHQ